MLAALLLDETHNCGSLRTMAVMSVDRTYPNIRDACARDTSRVHLGERSF